MERRLKINRCIAKIKTFNMQPAAGYDRYAPATFLQFTRQFRLNSGVTAPHQRFSPNQSFLHSLPPHKK